MVHQLADLVREHTGAGGTVIRCYFSLRPQEADHIRMPPTG